MAVTITTSAQHHEAARVDLLVVPAGPDGPIGEAKALRRELQGDLEGVARASGFQGRPGQTVVIPASGRIAAKAVLLVGVGDPAALTLDGLRRAGATLAKASAKVKKVATTLLDATPKGVSAEAAGQALAEGILLGAYQFLDFKSKGTPNALERVAVLGAGADAKRGVTRGSAVAGAVAWARDLINVPADSKSPEEFVAAARRLLTGTGVTVRVWDERKLADERMGGLIGVGQGSARPPRFMKITYSPVGRARGHVAFVGKGVVFDSGGLSLKPAGGMETMKTDMSGAAAVVAAMSVLKRLGVETRVTAYVPLVENMPGGRAIRPGDVLSMRSGTTVEVLNTDAEGRLILADALALAVEDGVDAIVDLATLTGACVVALGEKVAGLMGNDDGWSGQVRAAADRAGEPVWPLPLPAEYRKFLDSETADLRNIATVNFGGALTAGIFLEQFVGDRPWVHLDIAGPSRASGDDGYLLKGGTGFGVRTLIEVAEDFSAPAAKAAPARRRPAPRKGARR